MFDVVVGKQSSGKFQVRDFIFPRLHILEQLMQDKFSFILLRKDSYSNIIREQILFFFGVVVADQPLIRSPIRQGCCL